MAVLGCMSLVLEKVLIIITSYAVIAMSHCIAGLFISSDLGKVGIYDRNYVRLDLMRAKRYFGCPNDLCDIHTCSINHHNNFSICDGEGFEIIGEGGGSIKSGQ